MNFIRSIHMQTLMKVLKGMEDLMYQPYSISRKKPRNGVLCSLLKFYRKPFIFIFFILKGAIQGPEEFAEGLALGVRSLLGHAVGQYE